MKQLLQKVVATGASFAIAGSVLAPGLALAKFDANAEGAPLGATVNASELFQNLGSTKLTSELGQADQDLTITVVKLIRSFLGLLGIIAVVIIVWGGFQWMMAGGDEGQVKEAKDRILRGVIGMAIVLSAFAIAQFIISALVKATTGT